MLMQGGAEAFKDIMCPCCCMLPQVNTYDNEGTLLGSSKYLCDVNLLVPKFVVKDGQGNLQYLVKPNTCCGGCCILPKCGCSKASRILYIPFYIRTMAGDFVPSAVPGKDGEKKNAQINKVWSGVAKECCSDADNFQVIFPEGISSTEKANLLGLNLLIDFVWFENQDK